MPQTSTIFVEAASLILLKINDLLNFKGLPPHEIWLTWTRTNVTGGTLGKYDWRRRLR